MILVTGVAGFVGSNIARRLIEEGYRVTGVDDLSFGDPLNVPRDVIFRKKRFQDMSQYALAEFDCVIHCATSNIIYAMDHPVETIKNNASDAIDFFDRFFGKIIYLSTSSVYGNPDIIPTPESADIRTTNAYDTSKRLAEVFLQKRGYYTTLRLSNVYGENQRADNPYCGVIGKLIEASYCAKAFGIYGNGESTRDYTYVGDVEEAVLKAVQSKPINTEVNIGTGIETSVTDLISIINSITGNEIVAGNTTPRSIDTITRRCLDIEKGKAILKWAPEYTLKTGLEITIDWYKTCLITH